jgi:hypothetical protein
MAIGPNADILGMIGSDQGASSADASGMALQLRTKQGLMSLQNPFDGAALAHRMLGRYLVQMINRWSKEKIQRIIGRPVPPEFEKQKSGARFDCIIDTKTSSPTYRLATYAELQGYIQHGIEIPQAVLREVVDIPAKTKELWAQMEQQQMQQQLQQRQEDIKLEMAKITAATSGPERAKKIEIDGKKDIKRMDQVGDKDLMTMQLANKLAVEKMKLNNNKEK